MASKYFVNGGVDNLWGTSGNWATSSGGAGGTGVPATTDDVFFDASSPNMTDLGATRTVASIDFTGYTGTFDLSATRTLNVSQTGAFNVITLSSGMTLTGTGTLSNSSVGKTITTNGIVIPNMTFNGNVTCTLNDDMTVSGTLTLTTSAVSPVINGNTIYCQGSLIHNGSNAVVSGTTNLVLSGTGTVSGTSTSGRIALNTTINTAGTITFSGSTRWGGGTLTYTAGTVVTTGSTLLFTTAETINAAAVIWDSLTFSGTVTHTLSDHLHLNGTLTIGATTGTTVINGFQINVKGGLIYGGTSGLCSGTTIIHLVGTQSVTAPSRTTGACAFPMFFDAPYGTITISSGFIGDIHDLQMSLGTTIVTAVGRFTVGTAGAGIGWIN